MLGVACRPATRLLLTIEGDLEVPDEVDQLLVEMRSDAATFQTSHALSRPSPRLEETLSIGEGEEIRGQVAITIEGLKGNALVARGAASARYVDEATVPVAVRLLPADLDDADAGTPDGSPGDGSTGDGDAGDGARSDDVLRDGGRVE